MEGFVLVFSDELHIVSLSDDSVTDHVIVINIIYEDLLLKILSKTYRHELSNKWLSIYWSTS